MMDSWRIFCGTAVCGLVVLVAACGGVSSASRPDPPEISVAPVEAFRPPVRTEVQSGDTIDSVRPSPVHPEVETATQPFLDAGLQRMKRGTG